MAIRATLFLLLCAQVAFSQPYSHTLIGLETALQHGLSGRGQTVAVLDSGVAWDHVSLGGGLGPGYKIVGGWDFAEGDADPYDDAPDGLHGTHVTGIISADPGLSAWHGAAPDADVLALRVFDDFGAGYFHWVESGLQWLINNKDTLANPLTTINLSLGVAGNLEEPPAWATLEDEFLTLKEAGVFIAVSAGNSFSSYQVPGLAYPASSPHVVPVMSTGQTDTLRDYSQRHARAIAAPGQSIVSTIPDHKGNNNGVGDDYAAKSGTSMAAPLVAASSMLVREAMQLAGYEHVDQQLIYDHLMLTAVSIYDPTTDQEYRRLDLEAALDSLLLPGDFNYDGVVDAADYVAWRRGLGARYDQEDYLAWRANFGRALPSPVPPETVAEPILLALAAPLLPLLFLRR